MRQVWLPRDTRKMEDEEATDVGSYAKDSLLAICWSMSARCSS